jgi:hypothetical protein
VEAGVEAAEAEAPGSAKVRPGRFAWSSFSEELMMGKRKRTPEEIEAWRKYRREADERLRRARELVAKGLAELEAKRAHEPGMRRESS